VQVDVVTLKGVATGDKADDDGAELLGRKMSGVLEPAGDVGILATPIPIGMRITGEAIQSADEAPQ